MKVKLQKQIDDNLLKKIETFEEFENLVKDDFNNFLDIFSIEKAEILKIINFINSKDFNSINLVYSKLNSNVSLFLKKVINIEYNYSTIIDEKKLKSELSEIYKDTRENDLKIEAYIVNLLLTYNLKNNELKLLKSFEQGKISSNQFLMFFLNNRFGVN